MGEASQALRHSLRSLRRRPGPALAAVAILAVGLSAGVAAFTYVDAFRQPFPGVAADGLVRVFDASAEEPYRNVSYPDYRDYARAELPFDDFAATQPFYAASVRFKDKTEVAYLEAVSGSYFGVLGVTTRVGRGLAPDDDRPGAAPVAVLSHAWWLRSFGGRESVIGQTVYLNFRPFTVVGVASPDFLGTTSSVRPDAWIPFAPFKDRYTRWATWSEDRDRPLVHVYARLRTGASIEAAGAAIATMARGLDRVHPRKDGAPRRVHLEAATWIDPTARLEEGPTVRLMVVAAAVLLLLVCANVANLLLATASGRQRDMAVRSALGASPGRLVRQVLVENLLLSGLAGALALAAARPLASRLGSYFARPSVWAENVTREIAVRPEVAAFALAISLLTGLVAGLLPALRAGRRDLVDTLRSDATVLATGGGPRRRWLPGPNDLLIAAQVGLSLLLLVVAGLIVQTFASVRGLDPGFDYRRLLVTHVSTSSTTLEPGEREGFFRNLVDRLGEQPWVSTATVVDFPLLSPRWTPENRPVVDASKPATSRSSAGRG
jgi:predicted permease